MAHNLAGLISRRRHEFVALIAYHGSGQTKPRLDTEPFKNWARVSQHWSGISKRKVQLLWTLTRTSPPDTVIRPITARRHHVMLMRVVTRINIGILRR